MRHLFFAFALVLVAFIPALSQGGFVINKLEKIGDDERALLRKGFKLPDSAPVTEIKAQTLAADAGAALKLNLESILDPQVRVSVADWVAEWNQKEADKHGKIEIVSGGLQADVTAVRYLRALPSTDPVSALTWTDPKGKVHRLIPVYSYLLVCKSDGLGILWRKVDLTYQTEYEFSAKLLANELKKLMRARAKTRNK